MIGPADILNAAILVVDDKEDNLRLIEGMLRIAGYTCFESTTDPYEVCELYRRNSYSLILLDLQMPGMDGFQVMEQLKEIEGDGYLPVLVLTAQPAHKLRALEAGAKDFLSKPFEMAELRARVRNIIEVRLLHLEATKHARVLEATVRELEVSRELLRQKSDQELALAQETQESLLPRSLPQIEQYRVRAFNRPTRYVGGDFYEFLPLNSGDWLGVLGDVSGKGIAAALLSSMVLGALSMEVCSGTQTAEVLNRINGLLWGKSLPHQFVTLFLFVLSPDGTGHFISAGHNPARLFRAATGKIERLVSPGYALGMIDTASWESRELHLDDGDILIVYSDGVTDAENEREEMFGEERLREIIRHEGPSGSHALEQKLLHELQNFTQGMPQSDDITFVMIERNRRDIAA
jgi:serine phosphatase RsbU (regulator of sigma subunit)